MTAKEYEQRKLRLGEYQDTVRKLNRRISEAASWNERATRAGQGAARMIQGRSSTGRPDDPTYSKTIALSIEQECVQLTADAWQLREHLCRCIAQVESAELREVLEAVYVNGYTIAQLGKQIDRAERTVRSRLRQAVYALSQQSEFFQ